MSRRDVFHEAVKRGLEKEHWHISDDPLELVWEDIKFANDITKTQVSLAFALIIGRLLSCTRLIS